MIFENETDDVDLAFELNPEEYFVEILRQLGNAVGYRRVNDFETDWIDQVTNLVTSHPDPFVRAQLAEVCSLRQLHKFAVDEHVAVRLACASNPFAIDLDIQATLARDTDEFVVHEFLNHQTPYREVVPSLLASPHVSVRARLAVSNLASDFLSKLLSDPDQRLRLATENLDGRYLRATTRGGFHNG